MLDIELRNPSADTFGLTLQASVPRETPESPRQTKAKAKEAKKGRDAPPTAAAIAAKPSEDAKLLKKVSIPLCTLFITT